MSDKVGKIVRLLLIAVIAAIGAGCSASSHTTIADLPPYAGDSPSALTPLPHRPVAKHPVRTGGESEWVPNGGISDRWQCIVIHHSASRNSTPAGMRAYHMNQRGWDELGYHFVIGNGVGYGDGRIYVGERWKRQMHGAHCKVPGNHYNNHGIGICLIGNFQKEQPTPRQLDSLARLVSFLSQRCGIPPSKVLTHGGITHKTACPGRNFSIQGLRNRISDPRLTFAR